MFITFEGMDGSGKSTQIRLLAEQLSTLGREPLTIREPGGTAISEEIRQVLLAHRKGAVSLTAEVLLFFAARAQLVEEVILPRLKQGDIVIADRFVESSFAYQGFGKGMDLPFLKTLAKQVTHNLKPDVTFFLDVDWELSHRRQDNRGTRDRLESMPRETWERIRNGYYQMIAEDPARWVVLDASETAGQIHTHIWTKLESRLAV